MASKYTVKELTVMTTNSLPSMAKPITITLIAKRITKIISWPFTHRYSAPIWLALRL